MTVMVAVTVAVVPVDRTGAGPTEVVHMGVDIEEASSEARKVTAKPVVVTAAGIVVSVGLAAL